MRFFKSDWGSRLGVWWVGISDVDFGVLSFVCLSVSEVEDLSFL